jgi:hypothetical protein
MKVMEAPMERRDLPKSVKVTRDAPRMMGGDKSTWAPRPKIEYRRAPVAMEHKMEAPKVYKTGGSPSKMGGVPRPKMEFKPVAMEHKIEAPKVYKTGGSPNKFRPRIYGGDKSTWAPRPK